MTVIDRPAAATRAMTTAELLAIPDDGRERWLIDGALREGPMTRRNYRHSSSTARVAYRLERWLEEHPDFGGRVVVGEAGVQLSESPDSTVGVDVAYLDRALADATPADAYLIRGAPTLVAEILSPSDQQQDILEKVAVYLRAGVKLVWVMEPVHKTITVYRPNAEPRLYAASQTIADEPSLPGFECRVVDLFGV